MINFIDKYSPIVDLIANTFGSDCEVVLHDLSVPQNSVVYTKNNHVTGRKLGQSFDHLVTQVILSQNFVNDCSSNYSFYTADGRLIRSSTSLIRNNENKVIGAICLNIDTKSLLGITRMLQDYLPNISQSNNTLIKDQNAYEDNHITDIAEDLMDKIIGNKNINELNRNERIELIQFMEEKGLFLIKGVIDKAASKLGISKVTIYSYLDEIKASEITD